MLNFLFGKKRVGMSLVISDGRAGRAPQVFKAMLSDSFDGPLRGIGHLLLAAERRPAPACALVEALLWSGLDLLEHPAPVKRKAMTTYESICLYLQENFSFPLPRDKVATRFHLSPSHVSRLFRREGLIGFTEYLNRVRIDRAKFFLQNHAIGLDEITAKCGYADTAYFCRVFKRQTKRTPTGYREAWLSGAV